MRLFASRRSVVSVVATLLLSALSIASQAQQPAKVPRIGFVSGDPGPNVEAFRRGLRENGYVEGKNIIVDYRNVEGDTKRIPGVVAELVQLKIDVLVASQLSAIQAAKEATNTIPIVIVTSVDPVAAGLVDSFAHPGGNITGQARLTRELNGKRLELLQEVVPKLSRIGVLFADSQNASIRFKEYEVAAQPLRIRLEPLKIRSHDPDFERALQTALKLRVNALLTQQNSLINRYSKQIATLTMRHRLPSMCEKTDYVEVGCMMSYSANEADQYSRAATYVDKILKGAKPADLPIEQPTKFDFLINIKTAKQIGLTIPPNVLARADRVIR